MKKLIIRTAIFGFLFGIIGTQALLSCKTTKVEDVLVSADEVTFEEIKGGELLDQEIEYVNDRKAWFIRKGKTPDGNCIVERYPLMPIDDMLFMRMGGKGEKCTGVNCSHCAFKSGGGCECKNSLNTCNHEITRIRDLIRLR